MLFILYLTKTIQELIVEIDYFLSNRNNIRRFYRFRTAEGYFRLITGVLAKTIYGLAFLFVLYKEILYAKFIPDIISPDFLTGNYEWQLSLLTNGIVIAPLVFFITFMLRKKKTGKINISDESIRLMESNRDYISLSILAIGALFGIHQYVVTYKEAGLSIWVILFAIVIGCIINLIGRQYYIGKRMFILRHLRADKHTAIGKKLPQKLTRHSSSVMEKIMRLPLFLSNSSRSRVFCSYTHSSKWSNEQVNLVLSEFEQYGCECFVDNKSIVVGSSWRHQLRQSMSDADYVICFCDEVSCMKPWPAAELEAALLLRSCTIAPHITVVCPRDMKDENISRMLPVFRYAFLNEGLPTRFVKVARQSGNLVINLSKHGYLLQEDYLDKSLAGNSSLLFWIPFVLFSILTIMVGFFTSILPLVAIVALGIFSVMTYSGDLVYTFNQLGEILVNPNNTYFILLTGTIFYIFSSILSEFYWKNIVYRLVKKQNILQRIIVFMSQTLFCAFSIFIFTPVITEFNLIQLLSLFCISFIAMCAVSEKYLALHTYGDVIKRNRVSLPSSKENRLPGSMAEFRMEQLMQLTNREKLLKPMYDFCRRYKNTPFVELYGYGKDNPELKEAFNNLIELKEKILKCGHSYNIAMLFDDLGEYAGLLGRYQDCLNYYEKYTEYIYASLVSGYLSYSDIYSTYYKMAKIYLKIGKYEEAEKYAWYAMHGIYQNIRLSNDHLKKIWSGPINNPKFIPIQITWNTFFDRSITIGFKYLLDKDKLLFEEIKKFRQNL